MVLYWLTESVSVSQNLWGSSQGLNRSQEGCSWQPSHLSTPVSLLPHTLAIASHILTHSSSPSGLAFYIPHKKLHWWLVEIHLVAFCKLWDISYHDKLSKSGKPSEKNAGSIGKFSQMADPPFRNPLFNKKWCKYVSFRVILGVIYKVS